MSASARRHTRSREMVVGTGNGKRDTGNRRWEVGSGGWEIGNQKGIGKDAPCRCAMLYTIQGRVLARAPLTRPERDRAEGYVACSSRWCRTRGSGPAAPSSDQALRRCTPLPSSTAPLDQHAALTRTRTPPAAPPAPARELDAAWSAWRSLTLARTSVWSAVYASILASSLSRFASAA